MSTITITPVTVITGYNVIRSVDGAVVSAGVVPTPVVETYGPYADETIAEAVSAALLQRDAVV